MYANASSIIRSESRIDDLIQLLRELAAMPPEGSKDYDDLWRAIQELSGVVFKYGNAFPARTPTLLAFLGNYPTLIPVPGGRMVCRFHLWKDLETICDGGWEAANLELMREVVRPNDVVFDVGAHVGHFTLLAASLVGPAGSVYAFEPATGNLQSLREHIALNHFEPRVETVPLAVADRSGMLTFYDDGSSDGTEYSIYPQRHGEGGVAFTTEAVSLDQFCLQRAIPEVNFIKIDVEGAELAVLEGAQGLLQSNLRVSLLVELHPWVIAPVDICAFLEHRGMRLYDVGDGLKEFSSNEAMPRFEKGGHLLATRIPRGVTLL